ncbi:hypothetical protein J3F84DRAFT_388484 [Trichoderma pleuroticola]
MSKIIQNWSKCRSSTSATITAKAIFNTAPSRPSLNSISIVELTTAISTSIDKYRQQNIPQFKHPCQAPVSASDSTSLPQAWDSGMPSCFKLPPPSLSICLRLDYFVLPFFFFAILVFPAPCRLAASLIIRDEYKRYIYLIQIQSWTRWTTWVLCQICLAALYSDPIASILQTPLPEPALLEARPRCPKIPSRVAQHRQTLSYYPATALFLSFLLARFAPLAITAVSHSLGREEKKREDEMNV